MIGRRGFISGALGLVAAALTSACARKPREDDVMVCEEELFFQGRQIFAENPIIDDAPVVISTAPGSINTVRTSLPTAEWRKLNEGPGLFKCSYSDPIRVSTLEQYRVVMAKRFAA